MRRSPRSHPTSCPRAAASTLHYTCTTDGSDDQEHRHRHLGQGRLLHAHRLRLRRGPVAFAIAKETNKVITVVDDKTVPAARSPWAPGTGPTANTPSPTASSKLGVAGTCTDYTNIATIQETQQSDSQKVTVCVGQDLTVTKTAAGAYDRKYLWKIDKSVDRTSFSGIVSTKVTVNYTVKVDQTGVQVLGVALSGKITVTNPNVWEDIVATVTDAVNNGGTCTVVGGANVTVPKGGSVVLDYTCAYASAPSSLSGINTATATWNKATYFTPERHGRRHRRRSRWPSTKSSTRRST